MIERPGNYWHMLPEYSQGRKAIWDAVNPHTGTRRVLEAFPKFSHKSYSEQEMKIEFHNGATWQVVGADNYSSLMGTTPAGITMSEYALSNPSAWGYFSPILMENNGWALFISTPRGKNHLHSMLNTAKKQPDWFWEVLTNNETHVFTPEQLEQELERLKDLHGDAYGHALWMQEYFCSFDAAIPGSIWGDAVARCEREGRICEFPVDSNLPVYTAWDLGRTDDTSIIFYQFNGRYIDIFDHFGKSFMDIDNPDEPEKGLVQVLLKKAKDYNFKYATNHLPHDARPRTLAAGGKSILQQLNDCRDKNPVLGKFSIVKKLDKQEGIQAARKTFPYVRFHKRCETLIENLKQYHREWDEENRIFVDQPKHDFSSHDCLVAGSIVRMKEGYKPIENIKVGDSVWTPSGCSKVLHAGAVKKAISLIKIDTEKTTLTCTPEHKILTKRGFITADTLRYNDYIFTGEEWSCVLSSLFSMALSLGFRATITGETVGRKAAHQTSIGLSGNFIMEKYRKAIMSIMSMVTPSIIPSVILSVCQNQRITQNTASREAFTERNIRPQSLQEKRLPSGTGHKKDKIIIRNLENYHGKKESQQSAFVSIVKKHTSPPIQRAQNFAAHTAKIISGLNLTARCREFLKSANVRNVVKNLCLLFLKGSCTARKIVRLTHIEGDKASQLVYDLTVEKNACYQANGLLVSNSDAFRYLSLSWKIPKVTKAEEDVVIGPEHSISQASFGYIKKQHFKRMKAQRSL